MTRRGSFAGALAALSLRPARHQPAAAQTAIKFTLDWKFQGPTAAFFVAEDKGYFDGRGWTSRSTAGNGSAGAVTRVASGAYQMGFADINALVEFNVANPGQSREGGDDGLRRAAVRPLHPEEQRHHQARRTWSASTLGAPVFDATYKLFPAFAAEVGIDPAAVPRVNMDPPLREAMLVRGDVDVISGHYF